MLESLRLSSCMSKERAVLLRPKEYMLKPIASTCVTSCCCFVLHRLVIFKHALQDFMRKGVMVASEWLSKMHSKGLRARKQPQLSSRVIGFAGGKPKNCPQHVGKTGRDADIVPFGQNSMKLRCAAHDVSKSAARAHRASWSFYPCCQP